MVLYLLVTKFHLRRSNMGVTISALPILGVEGKYCLASDLEDASGGAKTIRGQVSVILSPSVSDAFLVRIRPCYPKVQNKGDSDESTPQIGVAPLHLVAVARRKRVVLRFLVKKERIFSKLLAKTTRTSSQNP